MSAPVGSCRNDVFFGGVAGSDRFVAVGTEWAVMNQRKSLGLVALIAIFGLFLGLIFTMLLLLAPAKPAVANCGSAVSVVIDAHTKVEGYTGEQLKNAAAIMGAGKALELSGKGQMISVMVSLGESGLRVLDYGDGPGPDSPRETMMLII